MRFHRDDGVAVHLHVGRDTVARAQRTIRQSDHGNSSCSLEQFADGINLGQRGHAAYSSAGGLYFLLAFSVFCLNMRKASLRIVSATSLFPDRFLRSCTKRFFIKPSEISIGVRGLKTRFRMTV